MHFDERILFVHVVDLMFVAVSRFDYSGVVFCCAAEVEVMDQMDE